jgi:putative nucleotidyltransferase with HDIG domain
MRAFVEDAHLLAFTLLAEALPRRWAHTVGVAVTAEALARVLAPPASVDDIVAAAWLHDIGYAPDLVDTGFHPIDGARHAQEQEFPPQVVNLIAHHTGAVFEAHERSLREELARYRFPVDVVEPAILSCADLRTGPDGKPVDPADRIAEVLQRYPAEHPVHRAIAKSAPLLVAQARLVQAAAETARYAQPHVALPELVECVEPGPQWRAVWSGDHYRVSARRVSDNGTGKTAHVRAHPVRGVEITLTNPPQVWDPDDAECFNDDLGAAIDASSGKPLGWHQYRAFLSGADNGATHRSADQCALTPWGSTTTFYFNDVVQLHVDAAEQGRSIHVQQRTFRTLGDVTDWTDLAHLIIDGPFDLRGLKHLRARNVAAGGARQMNTPGDTTTDERNSHA